MKLEDIKTINQLYDFKKVKDSNKYEIIEKAEDADVKGYCEDPDFHVNLFFAKIWEYAANVKSYYDKEMEYNQLYSEQAEKVYNLIKARICDELLSTGEIDLLKISEDLDQLRFKHSEAILEGLFFNPAHANITTQFFKAQIPVKELNPVLYDKFKNFQPKTWRQACYERADNELMPGGRKRI